MRGFHHATILSPSFHGVRKERLAQWPPISDPKTTKNAREGTSRKKGGDVRHASGNPYPISHQTLWFSLPYFRPEALELGAWSEHVTSCYGTYTVVGVNIKREMLLSPNGEEVANSSTKHTQFKTRVHKPYPISDPNGRNWYPISDQNDWKKKHTLWRRTYPYSLYKIMSLAAYASECNQLEIWLFQSRSQECTRNDCVLCWQTTLHWNINSKIKKYFGKFLTLQLLNILFAAFL